MLRSDVCYPYPLLRTTAVDYRKSCFRDKISVEVSETGYRLVTEFSVDNDSITSMIQEKKLGYAVFITCKSTMLRKMIRVDPESPVIELPAGQVHYRVVYTPYIIAQEDIDPFSDPDFAEEYGSIAYRLEKGAIIGIGDEKYFDAIFENDIIQDAASILSVQGSDTEKHIRIEPDNSSLLVVLPSHLHQMYLDFQGKTNLYPILNSIITVPALMEVIPIIRDTDPDSQLAHRPWFITIQQRIRSCALMENVDESSMYEFPARTAQIIMNDILADAMKRLTELS